MHTKTFIDVVNKPLVTYSFLQGTKYSLNRCGVAVVATGVFAGLSAYALTNKSMKKYVVPSAVVLGSGAMMLLLAKNNYSLKHKIATRGINYVQGAIAKQISNDHYNKSELCKAASRCLEYADKSKIYNKPVDNLSAVTNRKVPSEVITAGKEYSIKDFQEADFLLCTYVDNKIIVAKTIRADIIEGKQQQKFKDLESCNLKLNDYNEALLHLNIFIFKKDNSTVAHEELLNNLIGILSYEEVEEIHNILLKSLLMAAREHNITEREYTQLATTNKNNLTNWAKSYMQEARELRSNIDLMKIKYSLKVNSYGVAEFLNPAELIERLPK